MITSVQRGLRAIVLILPLGLSAALVAAPPTNQRVILITIDGLSASYLTDPQASLPRLRRLATEGAVAEGLRVSNPSVTWPNHTTLITGVHPEKHSVLFNGILSRSGPGEPVKLDGAKDQRELVAVPTLFDVLHPAGFRTAGINWPATRRARSLDDNFPDVPQPVTHTTPRLRAELIQAGILASGSDADFLARGATAADEAWTRAAAHLIRSRPPNFLLLHLLITDTIQHRYGPQSTAAYTAAALADAQVADLLRAVADTGTSDQTTVFVTSDHGFARPTNLISPNVVFRKAGLFRPAPRRRAQAIAEGGTAFVYLTNPATQAEDRAKVIALLREHEGIAEIVPPEGFAALKLPTPDRNPQMGDLLLVAKDGYAFADEAFEDESVTAISQPAGSHGYLASNPKMNGVFLAWGRGIKPGVKLGLVENIDLAPTIAALFGRELPSADGKVLREILAEPLAR